MICFLQQKIVNTNAGASLQEWELVSKWSPHDPELNSIKIFFKSASKSDMKLKRWPLGGICGLPIPPWTSPVCTPQLETHTQQSLLFPTTSMGANLTTQTGLRRHGGKKGHEIEFSIQSTLRNSK